MNPFRVSCVLRKACPCHCPAAAPAASASTTGPSAAPACSAATPAAPACGGSAASAGSAPAGAEATAAAAATARAPAPRCRTAFGATASAASCACSTQQCAPTGWRCSAAPAKGGGLRHLVAPFFNTELHNGRQLLQLDARRQHQLQTFSARTRQADRQAAAEEITLL